MIIGIKDAIKLIAISIMACCAVLVCTLFLNFYLDIIAIKDQITSTQVMAFYNAQVSTAQLICLISGGCLLITSMIMMIFYVKHYIDTHKKELGILKALGYSNLKIAKSFWSFGCSVLIGGLIGYGCAYLLMPTFYTLQNEDKILPSITIQFHPVLLFSLIIIPTLFFAVLAICYAYKQLNISALSLIKENVGMTSLSKKPPNLKQANLSFLDELKQVTLKSKKSLIFFIIFASFCFSSMTQMSLSVEKLSSFFMSAMIMLIGITLATTTLFLAITTIIKSNTKTIAMMHVFGYSQKQCCHALLGGYRPLGYIGFIIGTIYQYLLIKLMVSVVFKDIAGVPHFEFNFTAMILSFIAFVMIYEIIMYAYTQKLKKISIKEIMTD